MLDKHQQISKYLLTSAFVCVILIVSGWLFEKQAIGKPAKKRRIEEEVNR